MNCGHNAQLAALVAAASPGSTVEFSWRNGEGGPWVHNTGPVMTYMAPCGSGGCATYNSTDAEFFKISQLGQDSNGQWAMANLTTGANATLAVTLPTDLPAGEYLIRHELIAMQLGMSPGGAEFYPACVQINLAAPSGTPAPLPSGNLTVTFPGGYTDQDPGILDPDVYNPGSVYVFPGPPVVNDSVTGPTSSDAPTSSTPTDTSSISDVPTPTATSGCGNYNRKKKRVVKRIVRQGPLNKPRSKAGKPPVKRDAGIANPHPGDWKRADVPKNVVRSRVMRGVF